MIACLESVFPAGCKPGRAGAVFGTVPAHCYSVWFVARGLRYPDAPGVGAVPVARGLRCPGAPGVGVMSVVGGLRSPGAPGLGAVPVAGEWSEASPPLPKAEPLPG